jgi:hypothetical protein
MYSRDGSRASKQGHAHSLGHAVSPTAPGPGKRTQVELLEARSGDAGAGTVQRKEATDKAAGPSGGAALPADGGGTAMPKDVQSRMEKVFGTSLAAVRIHIGPRAAALGAKAYTQGTEIHFAPGEYQPESPAGQTLLGHELAHVIQQSAGRVSATSKAHGVAVNEDAGLEAEADEMGAKAARGEPVGSGNGPAVHSNGEGQPIQRVKIPGEYRLTSSANLRNKAEPYAAIEELPEDATVTVPVNAEELSFRLNILSRDHTYVTYRGTDHRSRRGWVKDSVLELATRNERGVGTMHFDREIAAARGRVDAAIEQEDRPGEAREKQAVVKLTQTLKPRITRWIPQGIDTSNLYAFVKALNHNILQEVAYTRTYNPPERCVTELRGDCRSICELNKYITETVLGVAGVQIESAKDGVRVAGRDTPEHTYTNHHWIKIGGQRFDAMEDRDFTFASWEVHRNDAWRTMTAGDVIQGISINEF